MPPTPQDQFGETAHDIELAPPNPPPSKPDTLTLSAIKTDDPFLIIFTPTDPSNPKNWPISLKWTVTDVLSATGFNRIMVSTILAPALPSLQRTLHMSPWEATMALSIYLLATAFGPLIIGPLSEVYGRKWVLHASNVWFLIWNLVCGFAPTGGVLIAARFLAGFGASAIYSLAAGVLGDVWRMEERGGTLGWYLLIPLLGAAVGPIIGGFMAERTTWTWMFWSTSIFQAVMMVASVFAFRETHPETILRGRAAEKRRETGDQRWHTAAEHNRSVHRTVGKSLRRPIHMLLDHPIIQLSAVLSGLSYGILYIVLSTFSSLWIDKYHQCVEISGLHYIAVAAGEIAGSQIGGRVMDRIFARLKRRAQGEGVPEYHLPLMLSGAFLIPVGLLIYGWSAEYRVHWAVVDLGVFIYAFAAQVAGQPLQGYVIDSYPEQAASATAASQLLRSLAAFGFPLFAPYMYRSLGYGWGNMLLAGVSLGVTVPAFWVLWEFGARMRRRGGG